MGSIINISIDLNKIDKTKIKPHSNGAKYYSISVDTKQVADAYGNTHNVYETQTKEEREAKVKKNYIGNGKEFVFGGQQTATTAQTETPSTDDTTLPF